MQRVASGPRRSPGADHARFARANPRQRFAIIARVPAALRVARASRCHSRAAPPCPRARLLAPSPHVNPRLSRLQPYPFERLRQWFAGVTPNPALAPINLSIGEPKHPTPRLILDALAAGGAGVANYPTTIGAPALREAIAAWLARRHGLPALDPATQVLPVLGSREALFGFAQTVDRREPRRRHRGDAESVLPDLRGRSAARRRRAVLRQRARRETRFAPAWRDVPDAVWARTQLALRLLARQSDRPRHDARRMARTCSSCPIGTAS